MHGRDHGTPCRPGSSLHRSDAWSRPIRPPAPALRSTWHAFTGHEGEPQKDYATVVDDLTGRSEENEEGGTRAAGVFDAELTAGRHHGHVVVDVPLLVSNPAGRERRDRDAEDTDRDLAARVVENLVPLIATVSPGAKRGSAAPSSWAEAVSLEAGDRRPRTLADALRPPVPCGDGDPAARAAGAMGGLLSELDATSGDGETRLLAATTALHLDGPEAPSRPDLAARAGAMVREAAT